MSSRIISLSFYRNLARRLAIFGVVIFLVAFAGKWAYFIWDNLRVDNIWFNDFFAIWSFAKFPIANHAIEIYDPRVLQKFQESLGSTWSIHLPYPYPPSFLLLMLPFGVMDYYGAYGAWIFSTFVLYFAVSWHRAWPPSAAFIIIFAPATILTFVYGQTGFLTSALMIGGFRFVTSRPVLSGVLFGLASFKPQLGILIPIALISARLWRTLAAAVVTVLALVLASGAAFGWSIWPMWLAKLLAHADWVAEMKTRFQPTIAASLITLGVDVTTARFVQAFVAVIVALLIWVCCRRGVTMLTAAALFVGTFLATPYAFLYDMPIVTNAVLAVLCHKDQTNRDLKIAEILVLGLALIDPAIMLETWRLSVIRCLPLVLLFGLIMWHIVRARGDVTKRRLLGSNRQSAFRGQQIG